ncbi:MAG TPA: hybrid sensor histidine kinase/response regulator [Elusimicrobia bacterium]|nr:MAG: hypothetical protein A2089_10130 [Elusimicrobia bacterium GWD2_63_28]HCC46792.1 hybrid sensor histidine kinase/response regulator [Elusimicrobiota bacterium]
MANSLFINLIYSTALLLVLVALYSGIRFRIPYESSLPSSFRDMVTGVLIGLIGIAVMANPWVIEPGVFFDTRSILLGVTGLFFGALPTALAVAITGAFRIVVDGAGALSGVSTLLVSAGLGLLWGHFRPRLKETGGLAELYLFGVAVQLLMLACFFLLPWTKAMHILHHALVPTIVIFPLGTVLLGLLLIRQRRSLTMAEELCEKEAMYRALIENSNDAVFFHGLEPGGRPTKFIEVSKVACERLGYSREELLALTPMDIDSGDMAEERRTALAELESSGQAVFEMAHSAKDGRRLPVEISSRVFEYAGRPHVLSIARDLTERKRADASLKEAKDLLESIVENVPLTIFLKNAADLRFVLLNRAGEELLGYNREALLNKNDLNFFPQEQAEHFMAKDREVLEHCIGLDIPEEPLDTAKRGRRLLHSRKVCIKGPDGKPKYLLGISEDITERKHAEQEKAKLEAQLQQSQKMEVVGRLAGGVAHDFNNILTVIKFYGGLIRKSFTPEDPRRADAKEVLDAAERAAALTRQLLTFSRRQIIMPKVIDLNTVIVGMKCMMSRLIREDVKLETRLCGQPCLVLADSGQMEQVFMNLLVNARDAMPHGGTITLETEIFTPDGKFFAARPGLPRGRLVRLTARDTGHGMTAEVRDHAFEPFFTTKPVGSGTGLGLSTILGIIEQSGGEIELESEPGKGTAFFIYLHLAEAAETAVEEKRPERVAPGGHETVLLVEDDQALRRLGERLLRDNGYAVLAAASGQDALQALERHGRPVDLLMTDLVMPGMNGRELAFEVARRQLAGRTLYMSGYTDEVITKHGVLEPGLAFIYKPYTVEAMTAKVRDVLDGPADQARA